MVMIEVTVKNISKSNWKSKVSLYKVQDSMNNLMNVNFDRSEGLNLEPGESQKFIVTINLPF